MLEKMLKIAKERKEKENGSAASLPESLYDGKGFTIKTDLYSYYNKYAVQRGVETLYNTVEEKYL